MRFRNNRVPYWFPAWVDGNPQQLEIRQLLELSGQVVQELEDRYIIELDPECLTHGGPEVRIEWFKECMEVLDPTAEAARDRGSVHEAEGSSPPPAGHEDNGEDGR